MANHGPKGGSAVAAAALNALLDFEEERIARSSPAG
ncbi:MAG: precorrin-8X methylmutase [Rubrobacteraceae bacterium]